MKTIILLFLTISLNAQIVSFETKVLVNGQESTVITQSSDRSDLIEFVKSVITNADLSPAELGFELNQGECEHIDVLGGVFNSASGQNPYPNGIYDVYLFRNSVPFYNNTSFPEASLWVGLNGLNPVNYIFKVVAVQK